MIPDHEILPYEENEKMIESTEKKIQAAISKRNYDSAYFLQQDLDVFLSDRKYYQKIRSYKDLSGTLNELNRQQKEDEENMKKMILKEVTDFLDTCSKKLDEMKGRHREELSKLDTKYSNPLFGTMRHSSQVQCLFKAENFYVKNRDFLMARSIKEKIIEQANHEFTRETNFAEQTVQSKVDSLVQKQEKEMTIMNQNIETMKNKIKKEVARRLQSINNKYSKERRRIGVFDENYCSVKMLPTDGSVSGVYQEIDDCIAEFQKELLPLTEPQSTRLPAMTSQRNSSHSSPSSSQRASPRNGARFSPRTSPRSSPRNSANISPRSSPQHTLIVKTRGLNNPSPPTSPSSSPGSPRNPRVARAFENSLRKSGYVQVI